ncbi:DMT family transporter [bacterium]|nr:DMT family transporter [bacterium]
MSGLFAVVSAAIFAASKDLCSKALTSRITPTLSAIYSFLFALPFYLFALLVLSFFNISIFDLNREFYFYVLLRALSDMAAEWCRMFAVQFGDVSLVIAFISLTPLFLLFLSPLITGDLPTLEGALGVAIITLGVFILAGNKLTFTTHKKGILFGLAAAFFFSLNACFDRLATVHAHPFVSGFWMTLAAGIILIGISRTGTRSVFSPRLPLVLLFSRGIFEFLFMSSKLWALQFFQAPYVVALTKVSLILVILGGGIFFREQHIKRRLLGGLIIILGSITIIFQG